MTDAAIIIETTGHGPEPRIRGAGRSVADIVKVAYDEGADAAAAVAGTSEAVGAALKYCAERACDAAGSPLPDLPPCGRRREASRRSMI